MKREFEEVIDKPFHLVVYHIGGGDGSFGMTDLIPKIFPDNVLLVEFEIRSHDADPLTMKKYREDWPSVVSVARCVAGEERETLFNVNKYPLSSSLLEPSELVADEDPGFDIRGGATWGLNTAIDKKISVRTFSLPQIIKEFDLPLPDFLSIDAQGMELDILRGAEELFEKSILGTFTEGEFFEIYSGQGLFHEQMEFYLNNGFRLVEPFDILYHHTGPRMVGRAFATVTEGLFIRFFNTHLNESPSSLWGVSALKKISDAKLVKLMGIARAFELYSYLGTLGMYVMNERPGAQALLSKAPKSLSDSLNFSMFIKNEMAAYRNDRNFFLNLKFDRDALQFNRLSIWDRFKKQIRRVTRSLHRRTEKTINF
jgi:FkbM family methyltransferase